MLQGAVYSLIIKSHSFTVPGPLWKVAACLFLLSPKEALPCAHPELSRRQGQGITTLTKGDQHPQ